MPLSIKLPAHDKIIINGAVVENTGDPTTIVLHNRADILRRKEVMGEEQATTPAKRVYYTIQCAYLFELERDKYLELCENFLKEYLEAAPSAQSIVTKIRKNIVEERYYSALRAVQKLITHETERMQPFQAEQ